MYNVANRKTAPDGFYTAKEAIQAIGLPISSFYNLVRAGTLPSTMLPGRKESIYPRAAIDRYARSLQAHIEKFTKDSLTFHVAIPEDIPEIQALVSGNFHVVPPLPESLMEAWMRRNPEALHILRRGDEIVGYISMFPLTLESIMKRMGGEIMHRGIPVEDIGPYAPGKPLRLYFADAVVNKEQNKKRVLGIRLLSEMGQFLCRLGEQGIEISEVYAVGTTPDGIRLCRNLGMVPLALETGVREDRIPFVLDIATSQASMVVEYRRTFHAAQVATTGK